MIARADIVSFDQRVDTDQFLAEFLANGGLVVNSLPESVFTIAVVEWEKLGEAVQVFVDHGNVKRPLEVVEVAR